MEQNCAKRATADAMVDKSDSVEVTSKPAREPDYFSQSADIGGGRHTQGGGEKDVEIVGTTGVTLPHNRFRCSEVREVRNSRPVFGKWCYR